MKRIDKDMITVTMYIPREWHGKLLCHAGSKNKYLNEIYREAIKFYIEIKEI